MPNTPYCVPARLARFLPIPCLAVLVLSTTGCWRVLMDPDTLRKTTPFGQSATELAKQTDRVNGWPLFYRNRDALSVAWPLFVKRENVSALFPFYEYVEDEKKDRTDVFAAMELLGAGWGKDYRASRVLPAWLYWRDGERMWWNSFFAAGGWRNPDSRGDYLFPVALYARDEDESTFCSIPYYSRETPKEKSKAAGLVLYRMFENEERAYRSVLFPFAHFWNSKASRGHALLPFYAWRRFPDGGGMFNSLPFSVCRSEKKEILNIGGPLYYRSRAGDSRFASVLWPIYMQQSSPDESFLALTPLFAKSTTPRARMFLCPLFYAREDLATTTSLFVSPLWSQGLADDARWSNCGVLLAHASRDSDGADYSFLADSVRVEKDKTGVRKFALGASFVRALSIERDGFYCLLSGRTNTLPGDGSLEAYREHIEATPEDERPERLGGRRESYILLVLEWGRSIWAQAPNDLDALVLEKRFDLFPLVSHSSKSSGDGKTNVLFFLWNSRTDRVKDDQGRDAEKVRRRFLRKAFDYERVGDRVSVDAFPFIALDRDVAEDSSRFSFLGPVLGRKRAGEKARWRVLGVPFGDRIEPGP